MSADLHCPQGLCSSTDSPNATPLAGGALEPLGTLPTELLQAIFGRVVTWPSSHWTERAPALVDPELRRAPFILTAVCSQWRDTALQTPEIWSFIHVTNPIVRDPVAYVDVCIHRSAQWPLEAVVDFSNRETFPGSDAIQVWFNLYSHGSRWRRCHFVFTENQMVTWDDWPDSTPMLEEMVVHIPINHYFSLDGADQRRRRFLPAALNLKRLSFGSIHSPTGAYSSLEYLSIYLRRGPYRLLWEVLSQTPLLREARIFWSFSFSREEGPPQHTIVLPRLRRLEIYGRTPQDFDAYVARLELPALNMVVVSTYTCYKLAALFQRFARQIGTLVIRYEGFSNLARDGARAVCKLRHLETLVISGRLMDNINLGDSLESTSAILSFSAFFDELRESSEMKDLRKIWMVNCTPRWKPEAGLDNMMGDSFEIKFTGTIHGKGWNDPRLALFMATEPAPVMYNDKAAVTIDE